MKLLYALHDNCQTHQPSTLHYNIRSSIQDASFFAFNGRATSMAPIYGISLFIQVEFVGSGFANPCLFHGVNLLTFIINQTNLLQILFPLGLFNASTKQVPFLPSPLLASPPSFTTKQVRRGCPCAAQSMARRTEVSASVLEIDPPCLLCVL